jgi:hypothetical protein
MYYLIIKIKILHNYLFEKVNLLFLHTKSDISDNKNYKIKSQ